MRVKVHLYSGLKEFTEGQDVVEVHGNTVGECLADLTEQFPRIKPELFDKNGKLLGGILISINLKSAYPEVLAKSVNNGDELYIVRAIPGG